MNKKLLAISIAASISLTGCFDHHDRQHDGKNNHDHTALKEVNSGNDVDNTIDSDNKEPTKPSDNKTDEIIGNHDQNTGFTTNTGSNNGTLGPITDDQGSKNDKAKEVIDKKHVNDFNFKIKEAMDKIITDAKNAPRNASIVLSSQDKLFKPHDIFEAVRSGNTLFRYVDHDKGYAQNITSSNANGQPNNNYIIPKGWKTILFSDYSNPQNPKLSTLDINLNKFSLNNDNAILENRIADELGHDKSDAEKPTDAGITQDIADTLLHSTDQASRIEQAKIAFILLDDWYLSSFSSVFYLDDVKQDLKAKLGVSGTEKVDIPFTILDLPIYNNYDDVKITLTAIQGLDFINKSDSERAGYRFTPEGKLTGTDRAIHEELSKMKNHSVLYRRYENKTNDRESFLYGLNQFNVKIEVGDINDPKHPSAEYAILAMEGIGIVDVKDLDKGSLFNDIRVSGIAFGGEYIEKLKTHPATNVPLSGQINA